MEIKEKTPTKEYKLGDIILHTNLPGERNPLPKLPGNLRWIGHERRKDTGDFISYIVDDPDGPQPTIDEFSPIEGEPVFKTKEEANEYSREKLKEKMDTAWERATSKDGRPPIGGAQDN